AKGLMDHREDTSLPRPDQYKPAHAAHLTPGGKREAPHGTGELQVNSLHGPGIRDLAPSLAVGGVAPDGVTAAGSRPSQPGLLLGVQWHPEWRYREDPVSVRLFEAFGEAVAARHRARTGRA